MLGYLKEKNQKVIMKKKRRIMRDMKTGLNKNFFCSPESCFRTSPPGPEGASYNPNSSSRSS